MKKIIFFLSIAICCACNTPNAQPERKTITYFDVLGFFNGEINRLSKLNPTVDKTVSENKNHETKQIKINDWKREFKLFLAADINKTAWKSSFEITQKDSLTTYTALDEKIPIKKLSITKVNGKVVSVLVISQSKNILYQAADTLTYYPDSLYRIKKVQNIKLLSPKSYEIIGKFKP